jgi:phospholipid transport system substrate-binding protein
MRVALILLVAAEAAGGPGSATEALSARADEIRAAMPPRGAEVSPEARRRIEALITRSVDLPWMLRASLGPQWKAMTAKQRTALEKAFVNRFRRASSGVLEPYRSTRITYGTETDAGAGEVRVPTRVDVDGEPLEIAYALRREGGEWRIVDIVSDGVSTVDNYRASFARVIAKEGVDGLVRRLERGLARDDEAVSESNGRVAP